MTLPTDLRYSKQHEWVRGEGSRVVVGITAHAAQELGDVVFVDLPAIGSTVTQFAAFGVVESVKAVSDLYSPISGTVVARNEALSKSPEVINADPYGGGWLIEVELANADELAALLNADAYAALIP
ncbi:MAG: glycine cleavage system protein GcvH [Candidatus Limnocylindrus sp.]